MLNRSPDHSSPVAWPIPVQGPSPDWYAPCPAHCTAASRSAGLFRNRQSWPSSYPPTLAASDPAYLSLGHRILPGQNSRRLSRSTNCPHIFSRQSCCRMRCAARPRLRAGDAPIFGPVRPASLACAIILVLAVCAEPQMGWVHASRNVTRMADTLRSRDRPMRQLIRQTVRFRASASPPRKAVSVLIGGPLPEPTARGVGPNEVPELPWLLH